MERLFLSCAVILLIISCASGSTPFAQLATVPHVDLARYTGRWYEIASFPQRFQKGCTDSRAEYRIRPDGDIEVVNETPNGGQISFTTNDIHLLTAIHRCFGAQLSQNGADAITR